MPLLEAKELRKSYGPKLVLDNLDLTCDRGEAVGVLGPNGAGKTTTLNMLAGALAPDSGEVFIEGRPLYDGPLKVNPRLIGLCPEKMALYPELTVLENLLFWGQLYSLEKDRLQEKIRELNSLFDFDSVQDDLVHTLSGGTQQRLNLAVTLLHSPSLLILDESLTGLDWNMRRRLLAHLRKLVDSGIALIYASHYIEEIRAVCDRVALLESGRLLACGPKEVVLAEASYM